MCFLQSTLRPLSKFPQNRLAGVPTPSRTLAPGEWQGRLFPQTRSSLPTGAEATARLPYGLGLSGSMAQPAPAPTGTETAPGVFPRVGEAPWPERRGWTAVGTRGGELDACTCPERVARPCGHTCPGPREVGLNSQPPGGIGFTQHSLTG